MTFVEGFAWVVFGALIGWVTTLLVKKPGANLWTDVVAGIIGAFVGGWIGGAVLSIGTWGSIPVGGIVLSVVGAVILVGIVETTKTTT